jgi:ppGpp synthetase/RelA/SpoT-type nucleotidyltranferase
MRSQSDFFNEYNISPETFKSTGLAWDELTKIYIDYLAFREELESSAVFVFNSLMKSKSVHSVRYRIKNPEHLIEKIIRKKIEDPESNITLENYREAVTDLIGLRALHLFKEDWEEINAYIRKSWNLKQDPVANYREGDSQQYLSFYEEKGCALKKHKYGYRSVHYIIETQPTKNKHYAEIQVRTIYEEAWSEIDHTIRYPYDLENPIFFQFLSILNRLSGGADEMGSFVKFLQKELKEKEREFSNQISEKDNIINALESKIEKLNIQGEELLSVKRDLERLKSQKYSSPFDYNSINDVQKAITKLNYDPSILKIGDALKGIASTFEVFNKLRTANTFLNINNPNPYIASSTPRENNAKSINLQQPNASSGQEVQKLQNTANKKSSNNLKKVSKGTGNPNRSLKDN